MIKKADWVIAKLDKLKIIGFVTRVSKDKKWADIRWTQKGITWSKRMPVTSLVVVTTIPVNLGGIEGEATDYTRKTELASQSHFLW